MEFSKNNTKKILEIISFTVFLLIIANNLNLIFGLLGRGVSLIMPFIVGACIAFIINLPLRSIENHLFTEKFQKKYKKISKFKRIISLILTLIVIIGILVIVIFVVIPELGSTIITLRDSIPAFWNNVKLEAEVLFAQYPNVVKQFSSIDINWQEVSKNLFSFLQNGAGNMISVTFNAAASVIGVITNLCIGFVFSIYILLQKEKLSRQIKMLLYTIFPKKLIDGFLGILRLSDKTFSNFFSGQCFEAIILGTMFFISMTILRFPYALLVGVLIAFTALIPIFGAFIGCAVGAFLILMISPMKAFWFIVLFLILQQIEGNLIYPHVVGNSVGLPSIWVLVAVSIGASTMGILGMLIFIPIISIIYTLTREFVYKNWSQKNIKL